MPENERARGPRASVSQIAADDRIASPQYDAGIEPEWTVPTGHNALLNGHSAGFVTEVWHRPYAEALLEDDPARLRTLIAEAERAILIRYLQLSAGPVPRDESPALLDAVDALSQLKKALAGFAAG